MVNALAAGDASQTRTVQREGDTALKYLPPVLADHPYSGCKGHGETTHLD